MDFKDKAQELIRFLRSKQSTHQMSVDLKFTYNIVSRWESGIKNILWADIVAICKLREIDLQKVLEDLCGIKTNEGLAGKDIVDFFIRTFSPTTYLRKHISAQKLRRLQLGKTQLTLNDFLVILEVCTARSERFFSLLLGSDPLRSLENVRLKDYTKIAETVPIAPAIRSYLQLEEYRHSPKHSDIQISLALGLKAAQVKEVINALVKSEAIHFKGQHYINNLAFVDLRAGSRKETSRAVHRYWRDQISKSLAESGAEPSSRVQSAFLIYETNDSLERELFELSNRFYLEFCNTVKKHEGDEFSNLKFMNIEFMNLLHHQDSKKTATREFQHPSPSS